MGPGLSRAGVLLVMLTAQAVADDGPRLVVQERHRGHIRAVAVHPASRIVAMGDGVGQVRLWDSESERLLLVLEPAASVIQSVAFSRDGLRLVVGAINGEAQVFDAAGRLVGAHRVVNKGGGYCGATASPDGKTFAAGGGYEVVLMAMETGEPIRRFPGPQDDTFFAVAFSPDGTLLAAAGNQGAAYLFRISTGELVRRMKFPAPRVIALAFHPDGRRVAGLVEEGRVHVFDVGTGASGVPIGPDAAVGMALSRDGKCLAVGGVSGTATVLSFPDGRVLARIDDAHRGAVRGLAFSPDGTRLFTGGDDRVGHVFDVPAGTMRATLTGSTLTPRAVAASPAGEVALAVLDGSVLRVHDLARGRAVLSVDGVGDSARVALSPDATHVAFAESGESIRVVRVADGETVLFAGAPKSHGAFALSAGARRLAARISSTEIEIRGRDADEPVLRVPGDTNFGVISLALGGGGTRLAMGGKGNFKRVHDLATGSAIAEYEGPAGWVASLAFTRDLSHLISGGPYSSLTVHRMEQQLPLVTTIDRHVGAVLAVASSPDGRVLLSVGAEGTLLLHELASGVPLGVVRAVSSGGYVVVAADGRFDYSAGAESAAAWAVESPRGLALAALDPEDGRRSPGLLAELLTALVDEGGRERDE